MQIYFDEHGTLVVSPDSYADCMTVKTFYEKLKQHGTNAIKVKLECPYERSEEERQGNFYAQSNNQGVHRYYNPYGYGPQSFMPMPPDFNPQMHWPLIFPLWWERNNPGFRNERDGNRGDPRNERDGRNENPRDTGRGDDRGR